MSLPKYHPVGGDLEDAQTHLIPGRKQHGSESRPSILINILLGFGLFASGVICTLWAIEIRSKISLGYYTYESGFKEDILLPPERIQLQQVKFGTPVDFKEDGNEVLVTNTDEEVYVGTPSKEIDDAWTRLLWGRYFSISEREAKELWGKDYMAYWDHDKSGWTGGFDMFHQLHCLNQIRQALHRDVYPEIPLHGEVHTEHCINHIRQSIMCWGSTAVTPIKYFPGYGHGYVKSDAVHTCRKFEPIREFVSDRFNGSLHIPRPSGYVDKFDHAF